MNLKICDRCGSKLDAVAGVMDKPGWWTYVHTGAPYHRNVPKPTWEVRTIISSPPRGEGSPRFYPDLCCDCIVSIRMETLKKASWYPR